MLSVPEKILLASPRGYCAGVDRAVQTVERALELYGALFTFYPDNIDYGLRAAECEARSGKVEVALSNTDALRRLPPPLGEDARIDTGEANFACIAADYRRAMDAADRAAKKGEAEGARSIVASAAASRSKARRCSRRTIVAMTRA